MDILFPYKLITASAFPIRTCIYYSTRCKVYCTYIAGRRYIIIIIATARSQPPPHPGGSKYNNNNSIIVASTINEHPTPRDKRCVEHNTIYITTLHMSLIVGIFRCSRFGMRHLIGRFLRKGVQVKCYDIFYTSNSSEIIRPIDSVAMIMMSCRGFFFKTNLVIITHD